MIDNETFQRFLDVHASMLRTISGATRGEWKLDDVRQEAWLRAFDLAGDLGRPLDLDDAGDAALLLRNLRNHCIYDERTVRHAHKLDHAAAGDDDGEHHWLLDRLVADDGDHPARLLEEWESASPEPEDPNPYHSPAAGWAHLLRRFDNRFAHLAAFLLISPSWCYACFRDAKHLAVTQWPLPHPAMAGDDAQALQPWRNFKLPPCGRGDMSAQRVLDFWQRPAQPAAGQLWLL